MPLPLGIELSTLARLILGGAVVLYLWPRYVFGRVPEAPGVDAAVGYVARMVVALIVAGYLLVGTHLYSWVTLVILLALLGFLRPRTSLNPYELNRSSRLAARLLTEIDLLGSWPARLRERLKARRGGEGRSRRRLGAYELIGGLVLLVVLAVSAWLRLGSPLQHASIPFSDSDVVIYWVQSIEQQILFPSGIYPEGFHIVIADLMRLTAANPIVTVKFFGPLVGVAMVLSVGFATYRLTGRLAPAAVAVLVYGTLPHFLPYDYLRQVGTDSQEFGNAFVLPTLFFVYASWVNDKAWYRGTAVALLAITGFTHPNVAVNAALSAIAGTVAAWLVAGVRKKALGWYVRWTSTAIVVAVLPIVIALAVGVHLNTSGAGFATAVSHAPPPPLKWENLLAIASAVALVLVRAVRLIARRCDRLEFGAPIAGLLALLAALAVREAAMFGIHSVALLSRSGEFVALAEALAYGMGLSAVQEILELLHVATGRWLAVAGATALIAFSWLHYRPQPWNAFTSARWLPDDFVVAYVDIGSTLQRGNWLAVSDDSGFDYAYGQGYFLRGPVFLQHVPTTGAWPRYVSGGSSTPFAEHHIFIFVDKGLEVAKGYQYVVKPRRAKAQAAIRQWVAGWQANHGPLHVYFRGPDVTVYELSRSNAAPSRAGQTD